ncbi:hypothetical protein RWE15_12640 [Virgibacillus halophilus]|uniref:PEP-CTERM protein-sorting domain-containing protein n=1 Tax=Tigheibacillus halophilus TaxID=361280 RepID=A0ABU5C701_9BACI|nr:hypothetical protein [Virgibacillus halophilus]
MGIDKIVGTILIVFLIGIIVFRRITQSKKGKRGKKAVRFKRKEDKRTGDGHDSQQDYRRRNID